MNLILAAGDMLRLYFSLCACGSDVNNLEYYKTGCVGAEVD